MRPISLLATPTVRENSDQGLKESSENAFSVRYTKTNGLQIFTGNLVQGPTSGTPLTEDPAIPTPIGDPEPGFYELFTAQEFFDPLFRYISLDAIELQWRYSPMNATITKWVDAESKMQESGSAITVNDLGTIRCGPWYGEPGMFELTNGGVVPQYLDENYINTVHPSIVHQFPTHLPFTESNPDQEWHSAGFIPIVPEVVNGDGENDNLQVSYQRLAPVNTIDWVAGNSQLSANLGWWMWYYPHATLAADAVGVNLPTWYNCSIQYRFKVRVTWFDLLPLQMFEYPTPTVDAAKFKEWALKVIAADKEAQAQELADIAMYKEQNGVAPPPSSPTADLADDMADTELVDPDDMTDADPRLTTLVIPPLKKSKH